MSITVLKAFSLPLAVMACMVPVLAHAAPITYDIVTVGNPGNANDPATGSNYGGVNYSYGIGKYDVTIGQYDLGGRNATILIRVKSGQRRLERR